MCVRSTHFMKLRTKAYLFFGTFLVVTAALVIFYAQYIAGDFFKKRTTDDFRIIAEMSESSYLSYLGSMKVRVLDWTSDNTIRQNAKAILSAPPNSAIRAKLADDFGAYVRTKKMPFDKTIIITDLLDRNGIVIASTKPERIGKNEGTEKKGDVETHNFNDAINSKFGEVFFGSIVIGEDESPEPTMNATVRLFDFNEHNDPEPLDAILLVYFENIRQVSESLSSGTGVYVGLQNETGRLTNDAFFQSYKTSEIYLVNRDRVMITHPREILVSGEPHPEVNTLPVRECFDNGKEISGEYDDYKGDRVLGSSMCFKDEGIVIIVEVDKKEVFAPLRKLIIYTIIASVFFIIVGIFALFIFLRQTIKRINDIVRVAMQVSAGKLDSRIGINTKDEIGYLGMIFNDMISSVHEHQKFLQVTKLAFEKEEAKDVAILENLGEGMVTTDNAGNVTIINRAAEKMLGWAKNEIIGKKFVDIVPCIDQDGTVVPPEKRAISMAIDSGVTSSFINAQLGKKNGDLLPIAAIVTPVIIDKKIIGAVSIFRDVTKERELEQTRRDLLSLASHQLRTPLSGTKWLIETLKRGLHGPLTAGQTEYLDQIYKINEKMTTLVHDMLGVLRMEGDTAMGKKEKVDVGLALDAVLGTLDGASRSKNITLSAPKGVKYTIETDSIILQNILECIISNAINYSPNGSKIEINIEKTPGELVFKVKDYGIGIPKDEQARLFERFYRASNAKTYDTGGTGLGLYIATMLAKKIGAHILFESEKDKGSTFFVHVPYFDEPLSKNEAHV